MTLRMTRPLGTISAALLGFTLFAAAPANGETQPRVIGGNPGHPLSGASVAIETSKAYCTGALWKERIVITAAHCINGEGKGAPGVTPGDIVLFPPRANRKSGPAKVQVTSIVYNQNWTDTLDDIAYLILDKPLGTPIITRMATPEEVQSLANAQTTVTYIGYGSTTPRGNQVISDVALSVEERLRPSRVGPGVFETLGDGVKGTCGGDSGGPWLAQINGEILYLGPLSGGSGLPCDPAESADNTGEQGAVATAQGALLDQALTAARTWLFNECLAGPKAVLEQNVGGTWQTVTTTNGAKSKACGRKTPYRVLFQRNEIPGAYQYRVVVPKQAGVKRQSQQVLNYIIS